ncbi:MAG: hypothetical protein M3015_02665 [Bacteroidota bacterium]|nr:hypothetical protein [Bacteroidota bacterium]
MKQVSNTKNLLVLSSSLLHSINPRKLVSNYRLVFLFAVTMLLISSCNKEDQLCKKTVPFKGTFTTKDSVISATHSEITGTGVLTHFGKSTFVAEVYEDNFPLISGTQIITAANGDEMFSTFTGSVAGPDANGILLITNKNIITGGTGRFAGATGNFTQNAIAYTYTPIGSATFDGTITLDECNGKQSAH